MGSYSLHPVDIAIVVGYIALTITVGLWFSRKAQGSTHEYFLGGRSIPWWLLGISGMANFVDMGGTARQGAGYLLFGAKGFWLCLDGAVALLLSFQMIYAAKWLRRSEVMTNAEWMIFRFGEGKHGQMARLFAAVSATVICIALMTFFFTGTTQVLKVFVPDMVHWIEATTQGWFGTAIDGGRVISLLFMLLVATYTVSAGFYGVIYADFVQAMLILFMMVFIGVKAFLVASPEYFAAHGAPAGWASLWPTNGQWITALPGSFDPALIKSYMMQASAFGIFIVYWLANNVLQGAATPFDAWTAQRYYAAKNEREASLTTWWWVSLWSLRFLLMAGTGVLALQLVGHMTEPEHAMSMLIRELMPVGIVGVLLAALFAAQMSTVDSTANSSAAYFVKDIYIPFIHPHSTAKEQVRVSYATTMAMLALGVIIGWAVPDVNSIWGWIMAGVFVGTLPPNIVKWFWWRANGWSYAAGTLAGIFGALLTNIHTFLPKGVLEGLQQWVSNRPAYEGFLFVFGVSALGTIIGTLASEPTDMATLVKFYEKTRPFGFWGPVRAAADGTVVAEARVENRRDLRLLPVACAWQLALFLMMSSLIFKQWGTVAACATVFAAGSIVLYKVWYKNLKAA